MMKTVTGPRPIAVEAPGCSENHGTATFLLRENVFIPEGIMLAAERTDEPEALAVDSIGCSIGAEGDSALYFYRKLYPEGRATLRGFDRSGAVLEAARRGVYTVRTAREAMQDTHDQLQGMGFNVQPSTELGFPILEVDAAPVRAGHDVAFVELNIEKSAPSTSANLRLVNNILYYYPQQRVQILRRLCETLPDNGVIALDTATMNHPEWRDDLGGLMRDEFDMEPLFTAKGALFQKPIPVLFGRPS